MDRSPEESRMAYRSVFRPGLLDGQVVIVTGAGSGIGRCTSHELAALGARAILVGRRLEKLAAVADEIRDDGGTADAAACDIREEDGVKALVAQVVAQHGRVHG